MQQITDTGRIQIDRVSIRLGQASAAFDAVNNFSLSIEPGQFVAVLGPSGCGKSTLLGALAGHLRPKQGTIRIDGREVSGPSAELGIVFQQHSLFPWYSLLDNVAFGLKMQGVAKTERHRKAAEFIELVGLSGFERRYPTQLSGGMQQRGEIARVLINRPRVLLMDEPFGALDAQTRLNMQQLLLDIWQRIGTTVVFITHDIDEALFLADRVIVMSSRPGRVVADLALDFARPRQLELVTSPEFMQLKRHCMALLRHKEGHLPQLTPLGLPTPLELLRFAI